MTDPAATQAPSSHQGLNVIALISGGKDSLFSLLHCRANGHHVVALANLHPAMPLPSGGALGNEALGGADDADQEQDLNSFMYQTVGHQVIPLYAEATGIPLYRRAIAGGAAQHGKDYSYRGHGRTTEPGSTRAPCPTGETGTGGAGGVDETDEPDETESMIPLLRAIKAAHPEANAICAGAIMSTYQRTRIESVATWLGLVPLAYLWKFPVLPAPESSDPANVADAQLLVDMAAVGLEARLVKVASGGLDDSFLWTNVASAPGRDKISRAMRRFGTAEKGAVIGEGGEFETLVLDGPPSLFRKRIVVDEANRHLVREGGGSAWLKLTSAKLEDKETVASQGERENKVRIPDLLDARFASVLDTLSATKGAVKVEVGPLIGVYETEDVVSSLAESQGRDAEKLQQWCFVGGAATSLGSVEAETRSLVEQIRNRLRLAALSPSAIVSATLLLRRMADFPVVNAVYGQLFDAPNPPSRVTVSCGSLLSPNTNIAVYLAVHSGLEPGQKQGLHVQSRSYWAPANIGPYSQAVSIPLASLAADMAPGAEGPRLVSIAGQIPLVPATMALPDGAGGDDEALRLQVALSLQHLWRIGLDTGVQWWTSAMAYFPSGASSYPGLTMALKVELAAKAWDAAHLWSADREGEDGDEDEGEDAGPDLWDQRFDPRYISLAGEPGALPLATLPDWSAVGLSAGSAAKSKTRAASAPPLFVAEVTELPRAADVEWHAHMGVAGASAASIVVARSSSPVLVPGTNSPQRAALCVWRTLVRSPEDDSKDRDDDGSGSGSSSSITLIQTVVAETLASSTAASTAPGQADGPSCAFANHDRIASLSPSRMGGGTGAGGSPSLLVRYVDVERYPAAFGSAGPVVSCASLWAADGERLASVGVYQEVF
ncbi:hypothetical protein B0T26DRAFT_736683 [Lasiosphaeria miniovina]|uniref:Diphthine--ammonia ligase n=1 Tax=Lasiosphaeria miniovina TaxID=1954250 RepID=A0AA40E9Z1_9PEZI|nr:uncharacterized protein B0T26DRAFT_736683 [Lasiosphaeria miniovina]KAK0733864.1 hypothetical protein B0T26DRAFT_736683 [Lasiosphaeria miniovina]